MTYPELPTAAEVASHFCRALRATHREEWPYRHWKLNDVLPEAMCTGILTLPIAPPVVPDTQGRRETFNDKRAFFTPLLRERYPACAVLSDALARPDVARQLEATCGIKAEGSFLRIEYIQDLDGAWLEPHRDIPEKLFSMVIYLCTGPDAKDWGTDIYDQTMKHVGSAPYGFNLGLIFIPGADTWHGFRKRPIAGVRKSIIVNYVKSDWRSRHELAFPERPVR